MHTSKALIEYLLFARQIGICLFCNMKDFSYLLSKCLNIVLTEKAWTVSYLLVCIPIPMAFWILGCLSTSETLCPRWLDPCRGRRTHGRWLWPTENFSRISHMHHYSKLSLRANYTAALISNLMSRYVSHVLCAIITKVKICLTIQHRPTYMRALICVTYLLPIGRC